MAGRGEKRGKETGECTYISSEGYIREDGTGERVAGEEQRWSRGRERGGGEDEQRRRGRWIN